MWINPQTGDLYIGMAALRAAYPQVCMPAELSEESLAFLGLAPVVAVAPPEYDPYTADLVEEPPELVDGVWEQQWRVVTASAAVAAARVLTRREQLGCSRAQGKLALLQAGLLDTVESWVSMQSRATQVEYAERGEWRRDWPLVVSAGTALGLNEEQLDALFILAATL